MAHELELITGILISSTALMGLSGLFALQLKVTPVEVLRNIGSSEAYKWTGRLLILSILFALVTIATSLSWLIWEGECMHILAIATFGLQTILFLIGSSLFIFR